MSQTVEIPTDAPAPPKSRWNLARRSGGGGGHEDSVKGSSWLVRIVVTIICLLWIVPTIGIIVTSFRSTDDANATGWWHVIFSPQNLTRLTFSNYDQVLTGDAKIGDAFVNSLAIALPATVIPILFAAFAAYAFTFMRFPGRDFIFLLLVSLLVVPNQVAFLPMLKLYANLGLNGKFAAVWLFHASFALPLAIFIFRNYMGTLPKEITESAKIDGATHFQTFWRLIVPMSVPALASFAIFQFLWVWNDLLVALIFIGGGPNQPLPIAVNSLLGTQGQGWQLLTAGGIMMMILPVLVFLGLQRYFVRGLTAGAVKG